MRRLLFAARVLGDWSAVQLAFESELVHFGQHGNTYYETNLTLNWNFLNDISTSNVSKKLRTVDTLNLSVRGETLLDCNIKEMYSENRS